MSNSRSDNVVWKNIKNYPGYQVSNTGLVRTHNKVTSSAIFRERHWKDRVLKYKVSDKKKAYATGYRVSLWRNGMRKDFLVARLVAFTFYEKDIDDLSLTVNHIDGNRLNNNISNLELISLADNIKHGFRTGLYDSQMKRIRLYDTFGQFIDFRSYAECNRYLGRCNGYITGLKNKGKNWATSVYGEVFRLERL